MSWRRQAMCACGQDVLSDAGCNTFQLSSRTSSAMPKEPSGCSTARIFRGGSFGSAARAASAAVTAAASCAACRLRCTAPAKDLLCYFCGLHMLNAW